LSAPAARREGSQGKREARGPWIGTKETSRGTEGVRRILGQLLAHPPVRVTETVRDPGAARPDGRLHLATFRPRPRREYSAPELSV
jgi:hypothetical protein